MRHARRSACLTVAAAAGCVMLAHGGAQAQNRFPCVSALPPAGKETRLPGNEMMAQPADRAGLPASTATWPDGVTIAWPQPRECLASGAGETPDRRTAGTAEKTLGYAPDPAPADANPFTVLDRSIGGPGADLTARPAPVARVETSFIWSRTLDAALPFDAAALPDGGGSGVAAVELPIDEDLAIGLAGGWMRARFAIDGGDGRLDAGTWRSAFYAVTSEDNWQATGLVAYEYGTLADPLEALAPPDVSGLDAGFSDGAETMSLSGEARAELSYVYVTDTGLALTPYGAGGLSWLHLDDPGLSLGSGLALAEPDAMWPYTVLGLRLTGALDLGAATLRPSLDLGWRHVFSDTLPGDSDALFEADNRALLASGAPIAADSLVVRAGFDAAFDDSKWRTSFRYSGDIAPENQQHRVTGGVALPF